MSERDSPWRLLPIALLLAALSAVVGGVALWLLSRSLPPEMRPAPPGVHLGGPATEDEKRIAALLTSDPKQKYEWVEWGPNDTEGLTHFDDPAKKRIVRVAFYVTEKGRPRTYIDLLYYVTDPPARIAFTPYNALGRDWLDEGAKAKKKAEEDAARRPRP